MIPLLTGIRTPQQKIPLAKALFHTIWIAGTGLLLGVIIKLLDLYTTHLGNLFSQMSIWIFLCALIAVYSSTPLRAGVNVFTFCFGMLAAYYSTAVLTASVYSGLMIRGWAVFALFTPLMAFYAWYAKGSGWLSKMIAITILIAMPATAIFLFDRIGLADLILPVILGIVLFQK